MRTLYASRQEMLLADVGKHLKGFLEISKADAGMHLIGWLPKGADDQDVSSKLKERGVRAAPVSAYCLSKPERGGLLLGYTAFNERQIKDGVRRMTKQLSARAV